MDKKSFCNFVEIILYNLRYPDQVKALMHIVCMCSYGSKEGKIMIYQLYDKHTFFQYENCNGYTWVSLRINTSSECNNNVFN